jgi:endonuclease-3
MKASEKQDLTKKLVPRLEKHFGRPPEMPDRAVLDTLVYAVCLENDSYAAAEQAYAALGEQFHDLNEIRVSSISELATAFAHQADPELRAHRVRSILQYVFEDQFEFDLEAVRKKTQEQAAKKIGKIRGLSPFIRNYVQQTSLGAHLVPLDDRMTSAVIWLGLAEPGTSSEAAADALKPAVRKADSVVLCHVLRCLATELPGRNVFDPAKFSVPEGGYSPSDAMRRVEDLLSGKSRGGASEKGAKPKSAKKSAKTTAAKSPAGKKPKAAESTSKAAGKKAKGRSRAAS